MKIISIIYYLLLIISKNFSTIENCVAFFEKQVYFAKSQSFKLSIFSPSLKDKRSKNFTFAPLKFDFQMRSSRAEEEVKEMRRVVEWERRGVNFGGCGSYSINDCLVQREFEDEFREPCNENTANEIDAGPCILMYPSRQRFLDVKHDFNSSLNLFFFRVKNFFQKKSREEKKLVGRWLSFNDDEREKENFEREKLTDNEITEQDVHNWSLSIEFWNPTVFDVFHLL